MKPFIFDAYNMFLFLYFIQNQLNALLSDYYNITTEVFTNNKRVKLVRVAGQNNHHIIFSILLTR